MKQRNFLRIVVLPLAVSLLVGCHTDPNVRKMKYLASGDRYSAQGKYRDAAIQYQNSLKADKNFPAAHYALAKAYVHMGDLGAAYRELARTVQLQPTNYQARIDLGNLLMAGGKTDDAEKQAKAALAGEPNNADVHALLSAIALKRGERERAMTEIQRSIELAPNRSAFYDDLALLQAHDPSQSAAAESNLKKAVVLNPKSVDPKLLLGAYYMDNNLMAEAEQVSREAIATDPKSLAARTNLAKVYLRENNASQAEQVLRQASQDLSSDPRGVRVLADYYMASGQRQKAQVEFANLVAKYPKNLDLQKAYLRVLIQMKNYATAQGIAKQLMQEEPKDPEIVALNGIVILSKGNADGAINALQDGVKNFPRDEFIQYWLGMAALAKGDMALAQRSFQQVVTLRPTSTGALDQLAQIAERQGDISLLSDVASKSIAALPNFAGGYVWRATVEMHQNAPDRAEADLKTAMQVAPSGPQAYLLLGELRFSQKRFAEGEKLLEQSLQNDPNLVQAMRLLVGYDLYSKQPAKALARVNAQIQKSPKNSELLDLLAGLQIRNNQLDQAAATAQKAMQMNPADAEAVMLFARTAVQRGQTANAINAWQEWTNAHPNDASAMALLGTLEEANGNKQMAQTDYQRSLQIQPRQPIAANNLAYLMLQDGGNVDVALSLAQIARQAMPNSPNTADTLAWAYYFKGTYGFARDLLEDALKLDPNSPTMQYHLGMIYSKMQDKGDAALHLKKAMILGHGTPTATDAQTALQKIS